MVVAVTPTTRHPRWAAGCAIRWAVRFVPLLEPRPVAACHTAAEALRSPDCVAVGKTMVCASLILANSSSAPRPTAAQFNQMQPADYKMTIVVCPPTRERVAPRPTRLDPRALA